jgi:tetratricopeptide (TPR) repeat protein
MTSTSMETAENELPAAATPTGRHVRRASRLAKWFLTPALLSLALVAAACSSGPSSNGASSQAGSSVSQGLSAESHGQLQQAMTDFNNAAAQDPTSPIAYYDLGVAYQEQLNNPSKAAQEYNKSLLADPTYKPALYNYAILETSSNPEMAINLYNQLLKINPNDPTVNFNLGLLLIAQNASSTQGHALLQKAIFLKPSLKTHIPAGVTP